MKTLWLRHVPLLAGAVVAMIAGVWIMFKSTGQAEELAIALVTLGAVMLGAWITMLAAHDYPGKDNDKGDGDDQVRRV